MTKAELVGSIILAAIIIAVTLALLLHSPAKVTDSEPVEPPAPADSLMPEVIKKPERVKPHGSPTPTSRDYLEEAF